MLSNNEITLSTRNVVIIQKYFVYFDCLKTIFTFTLFTNFNTSCKDH